MEKNRNGSRCGRRLGLCAAAAAVLLRLLAPAQAARVRGLLLDRAGREAAAACIAFASGAGGPELWEDGDAVSCLRTGAALPEERTGAPAAP